MISLDFTNVLSEAIGIEHGVMAQEFYALQSRILEAHVEVERKGAAGKLGFLDLPYQGIEAKQMSAWAHKTRKKFDTLVVLGIGVET